MNDDFKNYSCFSVRRLNPFLGSVQIVQICDSRAISENGIDWEIQILTEPPHDTWGASSPVKSKRRFLRFGVWSKAGGLTRVPANPLLDLTKMIYEANRIIEILVQETAHIPFPLSDRFELWLLDDRSLMPQALLASTTAASNTPLFNINHWTCSKGEFSSVHIRQRSETEAITGIHNSNKNYLETIVKQRTGRGIQQWYKRTDDGCGEPLSLATNLSLSEETGLLPAEAFPLLLLNNSWDDPLSVAVVSDYHAWLSPYLLILQNLPDNLRHALEIEAAAQALSVNACWRFYPKIIDQKFIDSARVEAQLRQSLKG